MTSALATNPFFVLGLPPDAPRAVVEREGQRLMAMLDLGLAGVREYPTPVGPRTRDADMVRAALAELRDPDRRLVHELWASLPAGQPPPSTPEEEDVELHAWGDALVAFGWKG